MKGYKLQDGEGIRVPPLGLIRCSRGGKTRALKEIARKIKSDNLGDEAAVIYISLNDYSCMKMGEQENPVEAICKRIAFEARHSKNGNGLLGKYNQFNMQVTVENIKNWLGDTPCVLLIDELNKINNDANTEALYDFLKLFLSMEKRFLVFSSHIVTTSTNFSQYCDGAFSGRLVTVLELPVISYVQQAIRAFDYPDLDARTALFLGLIPALIHECHKKLAPTPKRAEMIQKCIVDKLVNITSIKNLLQSFLTGESRLVMDPLLELMNTAEGGLVRWIPFHMMEALKIFSQELSLSSQKVSNSTYVQSTAYFLSSHQARNFLGTLGNHCSPLC
jgi:hypothetical protein